MFERTLKQWVRKMMLKKWVFMFVVAEQNFLRKFVPPLLPVGSPVNAATMYVHTPTVIPKDTNCVFLPLRFSFTLSP